MQSLLAENYLILKALHIIAFTAWMAGLFYLPRLYVYHTGALGDNQTNSTFQTMERKLLRIIMNPAMIATWIIGLLLLWSNPVLLEQGWIHVKLTAVLLLSGYHGFLAATRKKFIRGEGVKSEKFYRLINEIPTVLLIVIVVMAVLKPF